MSAFAEWSDQQEKYEMAAEDMFHALRSLVVSTEAMARALGKSDEFINNLLEPSQKALAKAQ